MKAKRLAGIVGIGIAAVIAANSCITVIPAGHTGVVSTFGAVSENVLQEGLHFKSPIEQVSKIDNRIVKLEVTTEAFSSDLQSIDVSAAINYRVATNMSYKVYKNIGASYENVLIDPTLEEVLKSVMANYTAEEAVDSRGKITDEILEEMERKLADYGITITAINITNFDLSDEYLAAVEAKVKAAQELEKAKTNQQQETYEKQQEIERQKLQADADLYSAQQQAEANKVLAESMTQALVDYYKVQKWNGEVSVVSGGTAIVDIGDISSLENAQ